MAELNAALLMFISARYAESRIHDALVAAGYDDLTMAQVRVAAQIGRDGTRLTDLAERTRITKQSANQLVDQLERNGYVERVPDPQDARAKLVRFAARGRELEPLARREERAIEREWTRHLGRERMRALREALSDLREVTDPYR